MGCQFVKISVFSRFSLYENVGKTFTVDKMWMKGGLQFKSSRSGQHSLNFYRFSLDEIGPLLNLVAC